MQSNITNEHRALDYPFVHFISLLRFPLPFSSLELVPLRLYGAFSLVIILSLFLFSSCGGASAQLAHSSIATPTIDQFSMDDLADLRLTSTYLEDLRPYNRISISNSGTIKTEVESLLKAYRANPDVPLSPVQHVYLAATFSVIRRPDTMLVITSELYRQFPDSIAVIRLHAGALHLKHELAQSERLYGKILGADGISSYLRAAISSGLAHVAVDLGQYNRAAAYFEYAIRERRENGWCSDLQASLNGLGYLRAEQRNFDDARRIFSEADSVAKLCGVLPYDMSLPAFNRPFVDIQEGKSLSKIDAALAFYLDFEKQHLDSMDIRREAELYDDISRAYLQLSHFPERRPRLSKYLVSACEYNSRALRIHKEKINDSWSVQQDSIQLALIVARGQEFGVDLGGCGYSRITLDPVAVLDTVAIRAWRDGFEKTWLRATYCSATLQKLRAIECRLHGDTACVMMMLSSGTKFASTLPKFVENRNEAGTDSAIVELKRIGGIIPPGHSNSWTEILTNAIDALNAPTLPAVEKRRAEVAIREVLSQAGPNGISSGQ